MMFEKQPTRGGGGGGELVQITGALHSGKGSGARLIFVFLSSVSMCRFTKSLWL
jgi:hypothetical protein